MQIEDRVMDPQERIGFLLRALYAGYGYSRYRMGKFEEYDLYSRNKDFLFSDSVITFTDPNGRLMALKPDVTLSIVKNTRDLTGVLQKLYYHENVYRVASPEDGFREMTQVGLECMGEVSPACVAEVLQLAAGSLKTCSDDYILEISHLDLLGTFVDAIATGEKMREELLQCVVEKNPHGIRQICLDHGMAESAAEPLRQLISLYGPPKTVMSKIRKLAEENGAAEYAEELGQAAAAFAGSDAEDRIRIDFSASGDVKYYNGIAFKGFISGIPDSVLSGGQYDRLMRRMGRRDRAVGFAVFLNKLERLAEGERTND